MSDYHTSQAKAEQGTFRFLIVAATVMFIGLGYFGRDCQRSQDRRLEVIEKAKMEKCK